MTRFGPRIEPITSPTPGGCATSYATDVGQILNSRQDGFDIIQVVITNLKHREKYKRGIQVFRGLKIHLKYLGFDS